MHRVARVLESGNAFLESGRWHVFRHETHCTLLQAADDLASLRVAVDDTVDRVRRVRRDAGDLERPAVRPARMAVRRRQVDGAVGHELIDDLFARECAWAECRHRPAAARNPFTIRVFCCAGCDRGAIVLDRLVPAQVATQDLEARVERVHVCVLEAWQHHAAAQVEDCRVGTDVHAHRIVRANERNLAIANRNGLRPRLILVHRVDAARVVDAVRILHVAGTDLLNDLAAFDDDLHVLQQCDVVERVAGNRDQVTEAAGGERANIASHVHVFGGYRRRRLDSVHRRHAAANHDLELAAVVSVRRDAGIGAVENRHAGGICFLEDDALCLCSLVILAHEFLGIAEVNADLGRKRAVVDVHRERDPAFGSHCDRLVVGQRRVLN